MPVLALTANTNPVDRERCLAAGMNEVLHKPMDMAMLMRIVGHHIAVARKGRS
jgi:CheY-like chemotaxis protein